MEYFIGMDAGGTKTESVLFDETGHILRRTVHPGCNPMDIGIEGTRERALKAAEELAASAPGPIRALYGGIAGLDRVDVELDRFLDQAVMGKLAEVRIIHGKGTGVVRQRVRDHLKRSRYVSAFRPGRYGEGEDGVTIATLK